MHLVNPVELDSPLALSEILDKALTRLANTPAKVSAAQVARQMSMYEPDITRLRRLWRNPEEQVPVSMVYLRLLVRYLCDRYPSMVVRRRRDGSFCVRFTIRKGSIPVRADVEVPPVTRVRPPRPGTTRWYLKEF